MNTESLVSFRRIGRSFHDQGFLGGGQGVVQAVRDIDLDIPAGRTLGIVGESGCGKSTLGRMAVGLLEPSAGDVFIMGRPLYDKKAHADYAAFRSGLAGTIQMIFQDPYSSLNPRMRIGESVGEPLLCSRNTMRGNGWTAGQGQAPDESGGNRLFDGSAATGKPPHRTAIRERVARMLEQVGLEADAARRYPHEFSGGQRQRIAIARALITRPAFVVCDEPTSSLDASVQSQVLNLLRDMQQELALTYMFISHDLAVVRHMSDQVAVMYRGLLMETGKAETVFRNPCHPYTRLLLESVPGMGGIGACGRSVPESDSSSLPESDSLSLLESKGSFLPENSRPAAASSDPRNATANAGSPGLEPGLLHLLGQGGCPFAPRCPHAHAACRKTLPELRPASRPAPVLCGSKTDGKDGGKANRSGAPQAERPDLTLSYAGAAGRDARLVRCLLYKAE